MTRVIVNLDYVKERNTSTVFKAIVDNGSISRIQIARQCGLAAGSVGRITRQLMDNGLIREVELQESVRGRKATSLSPVVDRIQILAARIGRTHIHIGLCDLSGTLLAEHSIPVAALNQQDLSNQIIQELKKFLVLHKSRFNRIIGIGLTAPGLINSASGVISYMPHLQVDNLPLADQIAKALGYPCYLANFTASMALAESNLGATNCYQNSLLINVHNGVGMGMILDNQLYEGSSLAVGEIGHIQIDPLGEHCYCGNIGCLETLVSNSAIEQKYHQITTARKTSSTAIPLNILEICKAANSGDELAQIVLKKAASDLGRAIALSVNLLRPDCIALGGEICTAAEFVLPVIQRCIETQSVSVSSGHTPDLVCAKLYDSPWYGGFALVRRALLEKGLLLKLLETTPNI